MSENVPSNLDNQVNDNNDENMNFIRDINRQSPFINEISYNQGERIIKITAWRSLKYSLLLFLIIEIIEIIIAFTVFKKIPYLKWLFTLFLLPIFIPFFFLPVKAICKYDYNNKIFSSFISPVIPISYSCFSFNVKFKDIDFFYFFKIKKTGKK